MSDFFCAGQGVTRFIAKSILCSTVASTLAAIIFLQFIDEPVVRQWKISYLSLGFVFILIAPVFETALLWVFVVFLSKFIRKEWCVNFISAALFSGLHFSYDNPLKMFVVFWSFLIFSNAILVWRGHSNLTAFFVATAIHSGVNALSFLGMLFIEIFK